MILLQIILPAVFVFVIFVTGHFFVSNKGSGLYVAEINFDPETILEEPVEIDPMTIDPDTGLILPDKYNYLKIELKTHDVNGISNKDFKLAKTIDNLS